MKIVLLVLLCSFSLNSFGITWKATVRDNKGSRKVYKLNSKRQKIRAPKSRWHCWISDIKRKKVEGFDSETRTIDCLIGTNMASVPVFCLKGDVKPKQNSMVLTDSRETKSFVYLECK